MSRTIHVGLSVRGALCWSKGEFRKALKWMTQDGQKFPNVEALRGALFDELAKGHEMLPIGEMCDRWDWKDGCQGHETEEPK